MNSDNYEKWVKTQLVPNLPPRSVVVKDNASYHNKYRDKIPTSAWRMNDILDWLADKHVFEEQRYYNKKELLEIVKELKPKFIVFRADVFIEEAGHSILRLPPYHPDLNPIELIWGIVKRRIATANVNQDKAHLKELIHQEFAKVTPELWYNCCQKIIKNEDNFVVRDSLSSQHEVSVEDSEDQTFDQMEDLIFVSESEMF